MSSSNRISQRAKWVWPENYRSGVNQYVEFQQEFVLTKKTPETDLFVSVDANYALWLNGAFVNSGQYHDFPNNKTYDTLPVSDFLRPGRNILHILAYYQGQGSAQYMKGSPVLIYSMEVGETLIVSGYETCYRSCSCYRNGLIARINDSLGFTFEYDARREQQDSWQKIETRDFVSLASQSLRPRPIKKLIFGERTTARLLSQGVFKRTIHAEATVAQEMQTDYLSYRNTEEVLENSSVESFGTTGLKIKPTDISADGVYLILDLGCEEAGHLELEVQADAGTVMDVAYGEHLDDLRVRAEVGGRNFASRYICKEGYQRFTHYFTRWAGRYLELHIRRFSKNCIIHYVGLRRTEYPVTVRGAFEVADGLHRQIYQTAVRTLQLCMHEHYEDCPWREQGLFAMDARLQALCGYYCFGNYDFAAASLDLLGQGLAEDGYFEATTVPAERGLTIPTFAMVWVIALADYYLYSGNEDFIRRIYPKVRQMMQIHLENVINDLLPSPTGERYWHFYDWAQGLDGTVMGDCMQFEVLNGTRFDALLNAFFIQALDAAALLAKNFEATEDAEQFETSVSLLRLAFHDRFWDSSEQAYHAYVGNTSLTVWSELIQSLALLAEVCPKDIAPSLQERLTKNNSGWVKTTLSQSFYKYEALLQDKEKYGKWVFDKIAEDWGKMLFQGATSFWETRKGGNDFDGAGSLCHGWSAIPVYFYQAYGLGIRPIEPGFKTFTVDAVRGILTRIGGKIPTSAGMIEVMSQEQRGSQWGYHLMHPSALKPKLGSPNTKVEVIVQAYDK